MSEFYIPGVDRQPLSDPAAWSYDPERPSPLQHTKDQLDKLFTTNDFPFKPTDYTPGEMGYLACFGDRLIRSLKDAESKITEDDPEREQKQKGVLDLTTVTTNRVRVIHLSLQALIPNLEAIHYYRSRHTGQPFIDAASRVFLFLDPAALAKAASLNDPEFDLASASPQALSRALYLNGCEQLVVNDGHLAYSASLTNLLPAVAEAAAATESAAPTAATGSTAPAAAAARHPPVQKQQQAP